MRLILWSAILSLARISICDSNLRRSYTQFAINDNPNIFNTDQGSQFTSAAFTNVLLKRGIAVLMNGRGAWRDNVFVERLWRSVKYEEVYLKAYTCIAEARDSLSRYFVLSTTQGAHIKAVTDDPPDQAYFTPAAASGCRITNGREFIYKTGCSDERGQLYNPKYLYASFAQIFHFCNTDPDRPM